MPFMRSNKPVLGREDDGGSAWLGWIICWDSLLIGDVSTVSENKEEVRN